MEWLRPPWVFWHPEPGVPFELRVRRFEVGLAEREVDDPPYKIVRSTIRFHVGPGEGPAGGDYVDFTNQGLIVRVVEVYQELRGRADVSDVLPRLDLLERLAPTSPEPLVIRLTRHGRGLDTMYELAVVEGD